MLGPIECPCLVRWIRDPRSTFSMSGMARARGGFCFPKRTEGQSWSTSLGTAQLEKARPWNYALNAAPKGPVVLSDWPWKTVPGCLLGKGCEPSPPNPNHTGRVYHLVAGHCKSDDAGPCLFGGGFRDSWYTLGRAFHEIGGDRRLLHELDVVHQESSSDLSIQGDAYAAESCTGRLGESLDWRSTL